MHATVGLRECAAAHRLGESAGMFEMAPASAPPFAKQPQGLRLGSCTALAPDPAVTGHCQLVCACGGWRG